MAVFAGWPGLAQLERLNLSENNLLGAGVRALLAAPDDAGAIRSHAGVVYAARNLLAFFPVAGVLPIAWTFAAFGALTGLVMLRLASGLRRAGEEVVAQEDLPIA